MNKGDLVKVIADAAGVTNATATSTLNAVLDSIRKSLKKEDKVTLIGFGTFSTAKRAKRKRKKSIKWCSNYYSSKNISKIQSR